MSKTKSLADTIKGILKEDAESNRATLHPKAPTGSGKDLDRGTATLGEFDELGQPVVTLDSEGEPANKKITKAEYPGQTPPVGQQPTKKLSEMSKKDEIEDDDEDDGDEDGGKEEQDVVDDKDDAQGKGKTAIKETFSVKVDMTESMNALFDGEKLTEKFKAKATAIFEAAVVSKVTEYKAVLDEEFESIVEATTEAIVEDLSGKVDSYLEQITENWLTENEVAVESSLRTELTEDFITGLRQLFIENHIDVPEEKMDIVEELNSSNAELTERLNEEIARNLELNKTILESRKSDIVNTMTEKLTEVQASKFKELAEAVSFDGEEKAFASKLQTIKESFFSPKTKISDSDENRGVNSGDMLIESTEATGPMAKYVKALSKTLK